MLASWPVLLMHDLVGIGLLFLMLEIWQQWKAVWSLEPRWSRELARQRRREALAESRALPGLARRPVCAECRAEPEKKEGDYIPMHIWGGSAYSFSYRHSPRFLGGIRSTISAIFSGEASMRSG